MAAPAAPGALLGTYTINNIIMNGVNIAHLTIEAHEGQSPTGGPAVVLWRTAAGVAPTNIGYISYTPITAPTWLGLGPNKLIEMDVGYIVLNREAQSVGISWILWHQVCLKAIRAIAGTKIREPPIIAVLKPDPNLYNLWVRTGFDMALAVQASWDWYRKNARMDANGHIAGEQVAPGLVTDGTTMIRPPAVVTDVNTQQLVNVGVAYAALETVLANSLAGLGRRGWNIHT